MDKISFTQEIKEELALSWIDGNEEQLISLLSAFFRVNGNLVISNKEISVILESENAQVIKFIYKILKEIFIDIQMHFSFRRSMKLNKSTKFIVEIKEAKKILEKLEINFLDSKISSSLTNKETKIEAYLAGLFLASGSCNSPSSSNYHLELSIKDESFGEAILKLINKIKKHEFNFKSILRRNNYVLYIKKSDQISDFISFIGANDSCFKFEDVRSNRDFSNCTNRLMNCDNYNYNKTILNSSKQIEMIDYIDIKLGIKNIQNDKIRELCYLRKKNPEATYNDLANELSNIMDKPISKSNINHLFRKINDMAKRLNYGN